MKTWSIYLFYKDFIDFLTGIFGPVHDEKKRKKRDAI
tara:strand:- start:5964 stop:6074 length:111 start_codon:yes stop_codon:yes gene_type:complete